MAEGLFRAEAVAEYRDPEARGGLVSVGLPTGALPFALIAAALVVLSAAVALVPIRVTADGRGVVRAPAGSLVIRAPRPGTVASVRVRPGQHVARGDALAIVGGESVRSPEAGIVDFVDVQEGEFVSSGATLAEVVPTADALVAFMAVPSELRARVAEGAHVRLDLDELPAAEVGVGTATVERVGAQLLSPERARAVLGADAPDEPSFLVTLRLDRPPERSAGTFQNGMRFRGSILVEERSALSVLVPSLGPGR